MNEDDRDALGRMPGYRIRRLKAGEELSRKGDSSSTVHAIVEGWAYRYKTLANGRRQIIGFLLPDDFSDLNLFATPRMDHAVACLTPVTALEVPSASIRVFFSGAYPSIAQALWAKVQLSISIQREWTVNLGQRSAPERLGHILCELFHRLRAIGQTEGNRCFLPLTQNDLADATGLSLVHVNKRVQDLRSSGLIIYRGRMLTIPSLEALERASLFDGDYLSAHGADQSIANLDGLLSAWERPQQS